MITLRRDEERRRVQRRQQDAWLTFNARDSSDPLAGGFGALVSLDEERLGPGASVRFRPRRDLEIITYVLEGALAHEDAAGHSAVIQAGEFERMTLGYGRYHSEINPSRTDYACIFRLSLRTSESGLESSREQKRFSTAQRRGALCTVASSDGRRASLRIHQDVLVHSALLDLGQHIVYALAGARGVWLHVVRGEATFGGLLLRGGDSAGITAERAVSLTAREDQTEILLLDLAYEQPTPRPTKTRATRLKRK